MIPKLTRLPSRHLYGDTAWVEGLFIPREQRWRGYGRKIDEGWIAKLPAAVRKIQRRAIDRDGGPPLAIHHA